MADDAHRSRPLGPGDPTPALMRGPFPAEEGTLYLLQAAQVVGCIVGNGGLSIHLAHGGAFIVLDTPNTREQLGLPAREHLATAPISLVHQ